jgi:hypothetical protein
MFRKGNGKRLVYAVRALRYLIGARLRFGLLSTERVLVETAAAGRSARPTPPRPVDLVSVGWAIPAVSRRLPWRSDCLIQAMAAAAWLRSHGISPELMIGVRKGAGKPIEAHAWLMVDGRTVVGDRGIELDSFTPILNSGDAADLMRLVGRAPDPASIT